MTLRVASKQFVSPLNKSCKSDKEDILYNFKFGQREVLIKAESKKFRDKIESDLKRALETA